MKKAILVVLAISANMLSMAQGKYDNFDVIRVLSYPARQSKCYNPTPGIGYYDCIEIPMGVLIRQANGKEASVCCTYYKLDGNLVDNLKKDFGKYAKDGFTGLKSSISNIKPTEIAGLDPALSQRLTALAASINNYKDAIDAGKDPGNLLYYAAAANLYDLTESFLRSSEATADKIAFLDKNEHVSATLFEVSQKGILNVSTTLIPFINDARDLYELVNGRDLITNEEIDTFGRLVSGVALVAGNGNIYRKAINGIKDSFFKKAVVEATAGIPGLTYTGAGSWLSDAGIIYRKAVKKADGTIKYENNLRHVLRHATPNPTDLKHTVFSFNPKEIPKIIDEAWLKKSAAATDGGLDIYLVNMGRSVGTKGEKNIRIIVEKDTTNIISAYPQ
jgi:hypothetical protein